MGEIALQIDPQTRSICDAVSRRPVAPDHFSASSRAVMEVPRTDGLYDADALGLRRPLQVSLAHAARVSRGASSRKYVTV